MDQTGIYNTALARLGVGQVIAAPTENSVPAKTCNRFYEQCRQEVLRAFPWGFALRAEALAEVADQTFPGWAYVYQYPNGCLYMRAVGDEDGLRIVRSQILCSDHSWPQTLQSVRRPFQKAIKDDGASQVILSDTPDAWAFYTLDVTNTGAMEIDFQNVLSWRLAMEAGGPLQAKRELIDAAESRYFSWLSAAAANTMNEQKDDRQSDSESISCRM